MKVNRDIARKANANSFKNHVKFDELLPQTPLQKFDRLRTYKMKGSIRTYSTNIVGGRTRAIRKRPYTNVYQETNKTKQEQVE
jgi:hypothetical protein